MSSRVLKFEPASSEPPCFAVATWPLIVPYLHTRHHPPKSQTYQCANMLVTSS